jgi:ABC-2 type transport system permease protein
MWRKLRSLTASQHALMLAYRAEIYLWVIAHMLPFIMMGVWTRAAANPASAGRFAMSPHDYARYFFCVFVIRQFTAVWMIYEFEWHIIEGRLSYLLLRPMNPLWHYVTAHFGEQLARFPFFAVVCVIFFLIYPDARWMPSPSAVILGIVAIYAAFTLRFAMQYCITMLTFWFERASALDQLTFLPYIFLSGLAVPLDDLSPHLAALLRLTPFPYFISFPAEIMMGRLPANDPRILQGFALMTAWFVAFGLLGALLWRRGLRHYAGQGA